MFWKLFLGFWITFFIAMQLLWVAMSIFGLPRSPLRQFYWELASQSQMEALATIVRDQGVEAARAMLDRWPEEDRNRFQICEGAESGSTTADLPGFVPVEAVRVTSPLGQQVSVVCSNRLSVAREPRSRPLSIPPEVIAMGALGALFFSAFMAWYLTRPVLRLRQGFERLAHGDLDVRLGTSMGRRRDEIADLARDFDTMAARLQQLVASKQRLLHEVSHELRSPLARVQVAIALARLDPNRLGSSLDRIEQEGTRLNAMVGELLALARAESMPHRFEVAIDMSALLTAIAADARFEAQSVGVLVTLSLPTGDSGESARVLGSLEMMRRAIDNVVRNAVRHSGSGQTVSLSLELDSDRRHAIVRVTDEGPGIPPELMSTVFDPFVRAESPGIEGGFGLGLAISRRTIEAHSGEIRANNRPERGLLVEIQLPIHRN